MHPGGKQAAGSPDRPHDPEHSIIANEIVPSEMDRTDNDQRRECDQKGAGRLEMFQTLKQQSTIMLT